MVDLSMARQGGRGWSAVVDDWTGRAVCCGDLDAYAIPSGDRLITDPADTSGALDLRIAQAHDSGR